MQLISENIEQVQELRVPSLGLFRPQFSRSGIAVRCQCQLTSKILSNSSLPEAQDHPQGARCTLYCFQTARVPIRSRSPKVFMSGFTGFLKRPPTDLIRPSRPPLPLRNSPGPLQKFCTIIPRALKKFFLKIVRFLGESPRFFS